MKPDPDQTATQPIPTQSLEQLAREWAEQLRQQRGESDE